MNTLLQDLRFALRTLGKAPAFTAIALLTLAVGIGANTMLFSVINGVLLRPLDYPDANRLVALYEKDAGSSRAPMSYLNFLDWERQSHTFSSMAIYRHEDYNLTGVGEPRRLTGYMVSAGFFPTLGVHPMLGRVFGPSDDRLGAGPVVVLGENFWRRQYGGSAEILGKAIALNGASYTVIGVLPGSFSFYGNRRDVYTPIGQWRDPSFLDRRISVSAYAVGQLRPGVTLAQAQADMDTVARNLAAAYPIADKDAGVVVVPMKQDLVGDMEPFLLVLAAAVGFLLLIACANVAALLLARSIRRSGELAIRAALGAGRTRLLRQLLTESLLLAGLGGAAGLLLAYLGTKAVLSALPAELPRAADVSLDGRVLLFCVGATLLSGIFFGLLPAFRATRLDLQQVLRGRGRGASGARHRLQRGFIAGEIALSLVLLVGAGLMLRSLDALWRVNLGYNPSHSITFMVSLPSDESTTSAETRARLRHFDATMRSVPGVEAVSVTLGSRPLLHDSELPFWIDGLPKPATDNEMPQAMFYLVEAGFQRAMGIVLKRGRFVSADDNENAPVVIDIDDVFARTYFPHQNPIGRHIHLAFFGKEAEIVGVVGHVRQWGPGADPRAAVEAQFFYPFMQLPEQLMPLAASGVAVVLRTHGDPAAVMDPVRRAVHEMDPGEIIYNVQTMTGVVSESMAARRLSFLLLGVFACLALALSCVGIFGVISGLVAERTHEIGVRMALGAQRGSILRLVLGQGARMALLGIVAGSLGALALTRLMRNELFGVTAQDPLTFGVVTLILLGVALAACYLPARRAMRVDPLIALRRE